MPKVIGIGETVFDIIFRNDQPVSAIPGGSTFNSMISLGRCGVKAAFLSETGTDHVGDLVCSYLEDNGVSSADVDRSGKSHLSLAFLNEQNDANYTFYKDHEHLKANIQTPDIQANDIVLFGSFYAINPVIRHKVKAVIDHARKQGAIIYYDINFRAAHKDDLEIVLPNILENFTYADIIRGSNEDFQIAFGVDDFESVCNIEALKGKNIIYTCGAHPTLLHTTTQETVSHEIKPITVVSTIGAGDNYNAGVIYSLIRDNITREKLNSGLPTDYWKEVLATAQSFSAECCKSINNSISREFAESLK